MCVCTKCDVTYDIPHWSEPPWDDDVESWAKHWVPKVQALGWSMADEASTIFASIADQLADNLVL
jgi:hypothetical protein